MSTRFLPLLLLAAATAAPAAAQAQAAEYRRATPVAARAVPRSTHQIFTLAWTEEQLPPTLAARTSSRPTPFSNRGMRFDLAWREIPGVVSNPPVAVPATPACERTILIAVPCDR